MPKARKGPSGPTTNLAGKSGTNRPASPPKGSSGSKPHKSNMSKPAQGKYSGKGRYGG